MRQGKILIIDDDPDITEAMRTVLENRGHKVRRALDGDEGMARLREDRPDLIILDVMIQKTGLDFKPASGDDAWLPVDEFLDKPIKPDLLLARVDDLLGKS
jgi:DNA-binding response OmpR family regulator